MSEPVSDDGEPGRPRRFAWLVPAAVLAFAAVLPALYLARSRFSTAGPQPAHSAVYYACSGIRSVNDPTSGPDDTCAREAKDFFRRTELTDEQRGRLEVPAQAVEAAVRWPAVCARVPYVVPSGRVPVPAGSTAGRLRWPDDCAGVGTAYQSWREPPGPGEVDLVRRSLEQAGFHGATVRLAAGDDPAPPGSIVYAVDTGGGCVIGYLADDGGGAARPVGRLPGGRCL
jgi:hypothetical protein